MARDVITKWIDEKKGISLIFTLNENGKYVPSSDNEVLSNWLLNETGKAGKIATYKEDQIGFVVKAAKERLKHPERFQAKQAMKQQHAAQVATKLWETNPIAALQEYYQSPEHRILGDNKQPILPRYETIDVVQGRGSQTVTIALILPNGETRYASADNAQEAKRIAALKYARDDLRLFGAPKETPAKTTAKRGYYQLGEVFSVDGNGNAHKLPKTEWQLFLGPDVWMGRNGKKYTIYRHEEPLASFEWGKRAIAGGGHFFEEIYRNALGKEIYPQEFYEIMEPIIASQKDSISYALYRGKPKTPLEEARKYSDLRPATTEEFYNTVEGFIEYYKLDGEIRVAEKRTYGTHGGNYEMLSGKVLDLEMEQNEVDDQILINKKLFIKPKHKEWTDKRPPHNGSNGNDILAMKLQQAFNDKHNK